MGTIVVNGGKRLEGEVVNQSSKNSALPILAATAAVRGRCVLRGCPALSDTRAALNILESLGCRVRRGAAECEIDASSLSRCAISPVKMHEMRSSILFLGPLLSRAHRARLASPGGCDIGLRPIDLHLSAMRALGAKVEACSGELECSCEEGLSGANITLSFPSVGATENVLLAACTARGETVLTNAAREPEITDLAAFLNACGAKIRGAGEGVIVISGVSELHGCEYDMPPDRIVPCTYLAAACVTGGRVRVSNTVPSQLAAVLDVFSSTGALVRTCGDSVELTAGCRPKKLGTVRTMPYPGFPTDALAAVMSVAAVAQGTSVLIESIFESRMRQVPALRSMGADILVEGSTVAVVQGVERLCGRRVEAPDLRSGAALVTAGLAAQGTTEVANCAHIERGYEDICSSLASLGADIYYKK